LFQVVSENYANPITCFFHVLFKVNISCCMELVLCYVESVGRVVIVTLVNTCVCAKAAALAFYILFSLFMKSFVIIFVITVLLAALDFWVVKNVSGRILVGLRWWNEIDDEGNSVWKFECLDGEVCSFFLYCSFCFSV
jgi:hypothetical protein